MEDRILHTSEIPDDLCSKEFVLGFTPMLQAAYKATLEREGLLEQAQKKPPSGNIGGPTPEETRDHFAWNFSGSSGRLKLAILDPKDELGNSSNIFIKALSGGSLGLLDAPCGSGASAASTLTTIAYLREQNVLPRLPLNVYLVAGDISSTAKEIAESLFEGLKGDLEKQAIFLEWRFIEWDVLDQESTVKLLFEWMDFAKDCSEYFVLMANFSGFLNSTGNFKKAQPQLRHILGWAEQRKSSVMWIEPDAKAQYWVSLKNKLLALLPFIASSTDEAPLCSAARLNHPIREGSCHRVKITLKEHSRISPAPEVE